MRLADKVAIITGGGRGIGRAIATRFAAEGARVVIAQRDEASALATIAEIKMAGGEGAYVVADVSQEAAVATLVRSTLEICGRIDILVNNAGIAGGNGPFLDLPLSLWQRVMDVNLTGAFLCGQAAARAMVEAGVHGRIINIGSLNSLVAQREAAAYVAAKGGVLMLTRAMAVDLAPYRILVNCIVPGSIRVDRNREYFEAEPLRGVFPKAIPLGRSGQPEEVAAAALFLASDENSFITGTCLAVDGGYLAYARFD